MIHKIYIEKPYKLDPITIYLDGSRITVICFCDSWTHYFGSPGDGLFIDFLKGCYPDYLSGKLEQSGYRSKMPTKIEREYVWRISTAILKYIKENIS